MGLCRVLAQVRASGFQAAGCFCQRLPGFLQVAQGLLRAGVAAALQRLAQLGRGVRGLRGSHGDPGLRLHRRLEGSPQAGQLLLGGRHARYLFAVRYVPATWNLLATPPPANRMPSPS